MVRALVQGALLAVLLVACRCPGLPAGEGGQLFQAIDRALEQKSAHVLDESLVGLASLPPRDALGRTPLTYLVAACGDEPDAATRQLVVALALRLITAGADVNAANADGDPPLHLAACGGQLALVEALLAGHAALEAIDGRGRTALMAALAVRWPNPEVVAALLAHQAGTRAPEVAHGNAAPLSTAISCRLTALDDLRQGAEAVFGGPPPAARAEAALRIIAMLLASHERADVAVAGPSGFAWPALHTAVRAGDLACARLLLDHGAEPVGTVDAGLGLMRLAIDSGKPDTVRFLAALGIGLDELDAQGNPVAFSAGDADMLEALLGAGTSPDARRTDRYTLLHLAAEADQAAMIKILIDRGAHADLTVEPSRQRSAKELRDSGGWIVGRTPLWIALAAHRPRALIALISRASPIKVRLADGTTTLHLAARWSGALLGDDANGVPLGVPLDAPALIRLLVAEGAEVNARTTAADSAGGAGGRSPLHDACLAGAIDAAEALLDLGADGRLQDSHGCEPWRLALLDPVKRAAWIALFAKHGIAVDEREVRRLELLQAVDQDDRARVAALLNGDPALPALLAPCRSTRGNGLPVLQLAIFRHDPELVRTLLMHGADPRACDPRGRASIHLAIESNQAELLPLLLEHGAAIDALSEGDRGSAVTPLAIALGRDPGGQVLREAVQNLSLARALLDAGADANAGIGPDHSALEIAVAAGNLGAVQLLLEHGARLDFIDSSGRSLLHLLAWGSPKGLEIAELLLVHGLDVNHQDSARRETPLHRLARSGRTPSIRLLAAHGATIDARDVRQRTPLLMAAEAGNVVALEALIDAGATIDAVDLDGVTPLSAAVEAAQVDAVAHLLAHHAASVQTELAAVRGWTHLRLGQHYKLQALLAAEPMVATARLIQGQTLLMRAADRGDALSVRLLLESGADPHAIDALGRNAVMHAVLSSGPDRAALISNLLKAGAAADLADASGHRAADLLPAKASGDARQDRINRTVLSLLNAQGGGAGGNHAVSP
jgi:ankyrin repeat protein